MSRITLTGELRQEYQRLFATCAIREDKAAEVDELADVLLADRDRYQTVGERLKVPWFVVAALHYADTGRDFTVHPHNGDPLTERTQHLPDGRPLEGEPPFDWEDSAADALRLYHFDRWPDWSIAGALFVLEGRGGWGYRLHHSETPSPYLERKRGRPALRGRGAAAAAGGTWPDRIRRYRQAVGMAAAALCRDRSLALGGSLAAVSQHSARNLRQGGRPGRSPNFGSLSQGHRALSAWRSARFRTRVTSSSACSRYCHRFQEQGNLAGVASDSW